MGGKIEVGSEAIKEIMRQAYGEYFLNIVDILGLKDFYGVVAEEGVKYCADSNGAPITLKRGNHTPLCRISGNSSL